MSKLREKMAEVNKRGLNLYMLINKYKKDSKIAKDVKFPDEVIERICDQYLNMEKPRNSYIYFLRVLHRSLWNHQHEMNKKSVNKTLLKDIMASIK